MQPQEQPQNRPNSGSRQIPNPVVIDFLEPLAHPHAPIDTAAIDSPYGPVTPTAHLPKRRSADEAKQDSGDALVHPLPQTPMMSPRHAFEAPAVEVQTVPKRIRPVSQAAAITVPVELLVSTASLLSLFLPPSSLTTARLSRPEFDLLHETLCAVIVKTSFGEQLLDTTDLTARVQWDISKWPLERREQLVENTVRYVGLAQKAAIEFPEKFVPRRDMFDGLHALEVHQFLQAIVHVCLDMELNMPDLVTRYAAGERPRKVWEIVADELPATHVIPFTPTNPQDEKPHLSAPALETPPKSKSFLNSVRPPSRSAVGLSGAEPGPPLSLASQNHAEDDLVDEPELRSRPIQLRDEPSSVPPPMSVIASTPPPSIIRDAFVSLNPAQATPAAAAPTNFAMVNPYDDPNDPYIAPPEANEAATPLKIFRVRANSNVHSPTRTPASPQELEIMASPQRMVQRKRVPSMQFTSARPTTAVAESDGSSSSSSAVVPTSPVESTKLPARRLATATGSPAHRRVVSAAAFMGINPQPPSSAAAPGHHHSVSVAPTAAELAQLTAAVQEEFAQQGVKISPHVKMALNARHRALTQRPLLVPKSHTLRYTASILLGLACILTVIFWFIFPPHRSQDA